MPAFIANVDASPGAETILVGAEAAKVNAQVRRLARMALHKGGRRLNSKQDTVRLSGLSWSCQARPAVLEPQWPSKREC